MAEKIVERLVKTVESLTELEVATVVADDGFMVMGSDGKVTFDAPAGQSASVKGAFTRMDLVGGDILTAVSAVYAPKDDGSTSGVMTLHQQQDLGCNAPPGPAASSGGAFC